MVVQGYTGRKLSEYTWIPKSKTYLREYREFLKICLSVEQKNKYFNDVLVGKEMVKIRAIVDRDNTADSYIEKYNDKTIGNQSYVSNARMMIRICRWLGWITKSKIDAKFNLTPYGKNLAHFSGPFPSKISNISEYNLVITAFSKLKFYSVNDSPQYRNLKFKQRIFLNMLRVLSKFDHCSHYELVVSAFVLKDERNSDEFDNLIKQITILKEGTENIGEVLAKHNLDCNNKSTVTGIYDGPKVMLSFARQLGLVENMNVNKIDTPKIYEEYSRMYRNSGYIRPHGLKMVSKLTDLGKTFVKEFTKKKIIWFDELKDNQKESAIIIYLNKTKKPIDYNILKNKNWTVAINDLTTKKIIRIENNQIKLNIDTDFDLFQDVPYEVRPEVLNLIYLFEKNFLNNYDEFVYAPDHKELFGVTKNNNECIYCAKPICKTYSEYSNKQGASDRFADAVCPVDAIINEEYGKLVIKNERCIGCMLCITRCPFGAIKMGSVKIEHTLCDKYNLIKYQIKSDLTKKAIIDQGSQTNEPIENFEKIISNFGKKLTIPGKESKKDEFYVCVRNYFRELGFTATYSGSGGMKTRSDITIFEPYLITSEVKSPAEGPINLKAIRQALDAAAQLKTKLTLAIGYTTHKGAIEQEKKCREMFPQVKICLIEIKYLLFLVLSKEYLKITPHQIKKFLETHPGYLNKTTLIELVKTTVKENQIDNAILQKLMKEIELIFT